jgi:glutamyl-tRNA reductase
VDYARRIFERFDDKTVLNIGAGKMATLVLRNLAALAPGRLLVCNRDVAKAQALAQRFGGEAADLGKLTEHLVSADIVVCSTGSPRPIITREAVEGIRRARRYRRLLIIDIAVPRDVEEDVGQIDNVYLCNLDHLQEVVAQTQTQRGGAIEAARELVARSVEEFATWQRARELGPAIDALYRRYHELAQEELQRTLSKMPQAGPAEREHLEELARRIVNKLLHDPVQRLRTSDALHAPTAQYVHALEELFGLGGGGRPQKGESREEKVEGEGEGR